ncbi:hypothetical protein [Caulobacter endophyticus]|nr:hypothetical protein [Caulobacter endophyticus]MDG2529115.1 hypothetical protein [Caulobacter endophyticus]
MSFFFPVLVVLFGAKTSPFDKLRVRFSNAGRTMILILSLSKDEDHAPA